MFYLNAQDNFRHGINSILEFPSKHKLSRRSILFYEKSNTSKQIDYTSPNVLVCKNSRENDLVIQTAMDNKTRLNVPLKDNAIVIVHFKCRNSTIASFVEKYRYLIFSKMCQTEYEEYYRFYSGFEVNTKPYRIGVLPSLNITLAFNDSIETLKLKFERCDSPENVINPYEIDLTQTEQIEKRIDQFLFQYSVPHNLSLSPIRISISEPNTNKYFKYENAIADVNIFIHKNVMIPCTNGSKINGEYCSYLCLYNFRKSGEKCIMNIHNAKIELPEEPQYCKTNVKLLWNKRQQINGSICEYFKAEGYNICKYTCIDLAKCRYMCVNESEGGLKEIGYQEFFLRAWSPLLVGTGHWSYKTIPRDKVSMDECFENSGLCKDINSCINKLVKYKCLYGRCDSLKPSRFLLCPVTDYYAKHLTAIFENILHKKTAFTRGFEKLMKYYYLFFANYKNISQAEPTGNDSFVALKFSIKLLGDIVDNMIKNTEYRVDQPLGEAYVTDLDDTVKEISIPLSNNTNDDKNQFVKLIFTDTVDLQSRTKLRIKFIRYRAVDLMRESKKIISKINSTNLETPDSKDLYDNQELYKNSDIFTLVINASRSVKVQYRMKPIYFITQSKTWLYRFEEKCAYLDESGDDWRWSTKGCRKITTSIPNYCECDHLSNFAVIFSMKMINKIHLDIFQYLSIIGGIINIISLMLFVIFILFVNSWDKLRLDQLNIALCLLFGTLLFLFGGLCVKNAILCKLAALMTQFLFLSAFIWKLIFGINVICMVALLRQQKEDWMVKYRIGALVVGYCVPLLIVVVSGSLHWSSYGKVSDNVCWIETKTSAFLTFIIPIGIILAVNLFALLFISCRLFRNYMDISRTKVNESNGLIVFFQLVITMGVTWVPSYFATAYIPAMYLLVIFFPMQGLFMFLIVVIMNQENREKVASFITQGSSTRSQNTEQSLDLLSNSDKGRDRLPSPLPMIQINDEDESKTFLPRSDC